MIDCYKPELVKFFELYLFESTGYFPEEAEEEGIDLSQVTFSLKETGLEITDLDVLSITKKNPNETAKELLTYFKDVAEGQRDLNTVMMWAGDYPLKAKDFIWFN